MPAPVVQGWGVSSSAKPDPLRPDALSDASFRLMVQSAVDYAIFMLDTAGRVASWNIGAERIKGYPATEIIGRHFSVFYPPEDLATGKPAYELREATAVGRFEDEGWRLRRDGSRFWANVVITALFDEHGELQGFGKVTRDLTERVKANHKLVERRRLFTHLVEAHEAERRRITWDVHDDAIQAMVAVGMRLQLLEGNAPVGGLRQTVHRLAETVDETTVRLRNLVSRLQPPALGERGLADVLSGHLAQVTDEGNLDFRLHAELPEDLPPETAVTIYRIIQEAVTNVRKHAMATTVDVSMRELDGGVLVRVQDDGVGLPGADGVGELGHFGLLYMRERAESAGGWWQATGAATGTVVEFWVPSAPQDVGTIDGSVW